MILSYKYRIEPNKVQAIALGDMLRDFCQLYNAALEHRIKAYEKGVSIKCNEQIVTLPQIRKELVDSQGRWSASAQQQVLRKLDKAYRAFFSRLKKASRGKTGFPRFRASARYHAADFRVGDGLTIKKNRKLGFVGVPGEIKVRWHRELPSLPKSAILTRQSGKWYIVFHVKVATVERAGPHSVGVDMGLTSLVALSNGETVSRPGWTKQAAKGLRRRQRAVARCKRGSNNRRKRVALLAQYHDRIGNKRRDFNHKLTSNLVQRFGSVSGVFLGPSGLRSASFN